MCFAALAITSCEKSGDNSELLERIEQLEKELAELRENQNPGFSETLKIYGVGETAVIYNGNVPNVSKAPTTLTFSFQYVGFVPDDSFGMEIYTLCYFLNSNFKYISAVSLKPSSKPMEYKNRNCRRDKICYYC